MDLNNIPYVQCRWYKQVENRQIHKLVIHSMEAPEKGDTAEAVAHYFATLDRPASAHYCVDDNSIVQTCQCAWVAYGAPGANHDGVHIELAGYARQTAEEWADPFSLAMLKLAAELCAKILVPRFEVPVLYLSAPMMAAKPDARGFTMHRDVSAAFHKSTHTDPGPAFPIADFLALVRASR